MILSNDNKNLGNLGSTLELSKSQGRVEEEWQFIGGGFLTK